MSALIADPSILKTLSPTTVTIPFVTVKEIADTLMQALVTTFPDQDLTGYVPVCQVQAENLVLLLHLRASEHYGKATASTITRHSSPKTSSINAATLCSLLVKTLSPDNPIMSLEVDLTQPVKPDSTAASWPPFYEQCNTLLASSNTCTISDLIQIAPKNSMAFGACFNHYLDSPLNSHVKEQLAACIANPAIYHPKSKSPSKTSSAQNSPPKPDSPWTTFMRIVKNGASYTNYPIKPTNPHDSAATDLKTQWSALPTENQEDLKSTTTIGDFEPLAKSLGFQQNWKNLLYAMIKSSL